MTVALAEQYGRHGICINAINPGPVATERWDQLFGGIARMRKISVEEAHKRAEHKHPAGPDLHAGGGGQRRRLRL